MLLLVSCCVLSRVRIQIVSAPHLCDYSDVSHLCLAVSHLSLVGSSSLKTALSFPLSLTVTFVSFLAWVVGLSHALVLLSWCFLEGYSTSRVWFKATKPTIWSTCSKQTDGFHLFLLNPHVGHLRLSDASSTQT